MTRAAKPERPRWHKPSKRQRGFCCTFGADCDVTGDPNFVDCCGAEPVVVVDGIQKGCGRCVKHDPRTRAPSKRPAKKGQRP